jgi:hypothetical protein
MTNPANELIASLIKNRKDVIAEQEANGSIEKQSSVLLSAQAKWELESILYPIAAIVPEIERLAKLEVMLRWKGVACRCSQVDEPPCWTCAEFSALTQPVPATEESK